MRIDGIILAAGLSARMGENKLLLSCMGRPLLLRALDVALGLALSSVILVTRQETAAGLGIPPKVRLVYNPAPERGLSSSIRLGLGQARGEGYLFFMADQPLLDRATAAAVLALADAASIVVPRHAGTPGNPVFFPAAFRGELMSLQGDLGGRQVRDRHPEACRYVDLADPAPLLDVDTREQYECLGDGFQRN